MGQCKGVTKKGERCKIHLKDSSIQYCKHHTGQANKVKPIFTKKIHVHTVNRIDSKNISNNIISNQGNSTYIYVSTPTLQNNVVSENKAGFIYVFTLNHLTLSKPLKKAWLRQSVSHLGPSNSEEFEPMHDILIKVGFTTQTPTKRLDQWREQCRQDFKLISPSMLNALVSSKKDKFQNFIDDFRTLGLASSTNYKNFDYKRDGFRSDSAFITEQKVHALLRSLYGFGKLYCETCLNANVGIHKEWFLVPRKDLRKVFKIINNSC